MRAFPKDLAKVVSERWDHLVAGDYITPPCPPRALLKSLLEIAYLAAGAPEEDRYPQFNIVAVPSGRDAQERIGRSWPFDQPRQLSVSELRRLAPAVDLRKSAIWVQWNATGWQIAGLVDLGTSWHRARMGLEYRYEHPSCLLVQIERQGRMRVYQGGYHVASLTDGQIENFHSIDFHLSLHVPAHAALKAMSNELIRPELEPVREFAEFEFMALWNTYVGIANSISIGGHGGAVVIVPVGSSISNEIKVKYAQHSAILRSALIGFVNARHVIGDLVARRENDEAVSEEQFSHAELNASGLYSELVEATRFVAQLAGCDGAIVISADLRLLGFGAEIRAELRENAVVLEVLDELRKKHSRLDVEQFGLRHRSAIKLVSKQPHYQVLVISQDGPISSVWSNNERGLVRRNMNLVNINMPWA